MAREANQQAPMLTRHLDVEELIRRCGPIPCVPLDCIPAGEHPIPRNRIFDAAWMAELAGISVDDVAMLDGCSTYEAVGRLRPITEYDGIETPQP